MNPSEFPNEQLRSALEGVHQRIKDALLRSPDLAAPTLIAVSKFQPIEKMFALYELGHRDFGENYPQELMMKAAEFQKRGCVDVRFHLIGNLQTNKVKKVLPWVTSIHSVGSMRLLQTISNEAFATSRSVEVYFQMNLDGEATKGGFLPEELETLVTWINQNRGNLNLVFAGLMTIPNPELARREAFRNLAKFSRQYGQILGSGLSMGMSDDFEEAIEEGSTAVRVGTALFGIRASPSH